MTTMTAPDIEALTLRIEQETRVKASLAITFAALLEELGPSGTKPDGTPMDMKIEPVPGGRHQGMQLLPGPARRPRAVGDQKNRG